MYAFPGRRNLGYLFAFESRRAEVMASNQAGAQQQQPGGQAQGKVDGAGNPIATAATPVRRRFVPLEEYERQGIFKSRGGVPHGAPTSMAYPSPRAPILNANAIYGESLGMIRDMRSDRGESEREISLRERVLQYNIMCVMLLILH